MRRSPTTPAHDRSARQRAITAGCVAVLLGGALSACTSGAPSPHHTPSTALSAAQSSPEPAPGSSDDSAGATTGPASGIAGSSPAQPSGAGTDVPSSPAAPDQAPSSTRSSTRPVQIVVTYHGWDASAAAAEVNAFATGVIDSDAQCTLTMSHLGVSRSASRHATPSASTTQCGQLEVAGSQLSPGDWTATVEYSSSTAAGKSAAFTIRVPA